MQGRPIARLSLDLVALERSRFESLSLEVGTRNKQLFPLPNGRKARIAKLLNLGIEIRSGVVRDSGSRRQPNRNSGRRQAATGSCQREAGDECLTDKTCWVRRAEKLHRSQDRNSIFASG